MSDFIKAFKPAAWTSLFVFIATFGLAVAGWLGEVMAWSSDESGTVVFPDKSGLVKAGIAAGVAAASGLVNFVVRFVQAKLGWGQVPVYVPPAQTPPEA